MPIDTSSIRWIINGEPLDEEVLNRPIRDLADAIPDATVTIKGLVELATVSEATTGTDTVRAVTPAGLKAAVDAAFANIPQDTYPFSKTTNGYFQDQSGIIIQWGQGVSVTGKRDYVSYPIPFPNTCLQTICLEGNAIGWEVMFDTGGPLYCTVHGITLPTLESLKKVGFYHSVMSVQAGSVNFAAGITYRYISVGY